MELVNAPPPEKRIKLDNSYCDKKTEDYYYYKNVFHKTLLESEVNAKIENLLKFHENYLNFLYATTSIFGDEAQLNVKDKNIHKSFEETEKPVTLDKENCVPLINKNECNNNHCTESLITDKSENHSNSLNKNNEEYINDELIGEEKGKLHNNEYIKNPLQFQSKSQILVSQTYCVKSIRNKNFMDELKVLDDPLAANYSKAFNHQPFALKKVPKFSQEYNKVHRMFKESKPRLAIRRLQRVEAPYLLAMYLMKKEKMLAQKKVVYERNLFHGTKKTNIGKICRNNFDWRKRGQSRGHKFGQGVSFSPKSSYACHYTPKQDKVMIMAKVLVGTSTVGDSQTVLPPRGFDTTRSNTGSVLVKYEDDDFLPVYVIYFW